MKFFKKSLVNRITAIVISLLIATCGLTIFMGSWSLTTHLTTAIFDEFTTQSESNAHQIQGIFNLALSPLEDIEMYSTDLMNAFSDDVASEEAVKSEIYGAEIPKDVAVWEEYMLHSMKNTTSRSADIVGMGIILDPYAIHENLPEYSFYITESTVNQPVEHFMDYADFKGEEFYTGPKAAQALYATSPYPTDEGIYVFSLCLPMYKDNAFIGVMASDISIERMQYVDSRNEHYPSMFSAVLDHTLGIAYDGSGNSTLGTSFSSLFADTNDYNNVLENINKGVAFNSSMKDNAGNTLHFFFSPITLGGYTWWSVTALETADMYQDVISSTILLIVVSLIGGIITGTILSRLLIKNLSPLKTLADVSEQLSQGSFDFTLDIHSEDEIGILANTFAQMGYTLNEIIKDITEVLESVSNGELDVDSTAEYYGDLENIEISMKDIVSSMNEIMIDINSSSTQVEAGARKVASSAEILSGGAMDQLRSVEVLRDSMANIAENTKLNANTSSQAEEKFVEFAGGIKDSYDHIREVVEAMDNITTSSNEIIKIVKTIDDIAFQTNILALNAAVEAARAGQAGKGFAVVADEVRNLASKSAEAAQSTTDLIQNSINAIEIGTKVAYSSESSMNVVIEQIDDTTALIQDIASASTEQAEAIGKVANEIDQIAEVVQSNSATSEESAAASEELLAEAASLQEMIQRFHVKQ
ncbi:MAG: methyl-accepting chemotaxis protein [Bacillota bacterium]